MIGMVSCKYAVRSLFRHTRRTLLSVLGVGVGTGIALLAASWMSGARETQIRAIAESGGGHLQVVPETWTENRENTLRLTDWQRVLAEARALPNVKYTSARAHANGLLALGNRMAGVSVMGVDPETEKTSNRIVWKSKIEGRYLDPDDTGCCVIGSTLAKRLDVELDDDLFVTLAGRDDIQSAMLTVVGILDSGSQDLDATICHVSLSELETITGIEGVAEVGIVLDDYRLTDARRKDLAERIPTGNEVITWREVNPSLAGNVEGDTAFTKILVGIVVVVVCFGIASAQLTAVLERRTEFAILSALGMKGRRLVELILMEALVVGLAGAVVGLLLGGAAAYYLSTTGVNLGKLMGDTSFGDVLLDPYMYGDFGPWLIWYALGISIVSTVAASLYPARLATKGDPASALRME